jgi:hypothetical protein
MKAQTTFLEWRDIMDTQCEDIFLKNKMSNFNYSEKVSKNDICLIKFSKNWRELRKNRKCCVSNKKEDMMT